MPGTAASASRAGELQLDVAVELVEAPLAAELGSRRGRAGGRGGLQVLWVGHRLAFASERVEAAAGKLDAKLAAGVVQGLVERAARGPEPLGEDVDRHAVERERDEDIALVRRQGPVDRLGERRR